MRISDWSSDMCSSDLVRILPDRMLGRARPAPIVGRAGWLVGRACAAHDKDGKRGLPRRRAQVRDQRAIAAFVLRLIGNRFVACVIGSDMDDRTAAHTSELQSLMRKANSVFCLNKKKNKIGIPTQ